MPRPSVVAVAVAVAVALCSCAAVQSRIVQRDEKAWWDSLTHEQREEILKSAVPVGHEAANAADRGGAPAATKEPNGVDGKGHEWNSKRLIVSPNRDSSGKPIWPPLETYGLSYKFQAYLPGKENLCMAVVQRLDRQYMDISHVMERLVKDNVFEDVRLDYVVRSAGINTQGDMFHLRRDEDFPSYTYRDNSEVEARLGDVQPAQPNDPGWSNQWWMRQIRGDLTLGLGTTGEDIVVAVVDTGCNINHPDLEPNLWRNLAEIEGQDGVDDDGNGFVDDKFGFNFADGNDDLSDPTSHGTHVAGVFAAEANNGVGIAGLAPGVKVMCLKFLNEDGSGFQSDAIQSIAYAIMMRAHILNFSWGGPGLSSGLERAVRLAGEMGHFMAAAAGNSGVNEDIRENLVYPAGFSRADLFPETAPYIMSVAASDYFDDLGFFSNYGVGSVDLAAPGLNIVSLNSMVNQASGLLSLSGTSMATPMVSGAAAIVLSVLSARASSGSDSTLPDAFDGNDLDASIIKEILLLSAEGIPTLKQFVKSGARLDVFAAVQLVLTGEITDVLPRSNGVPVWVWIVLGTVALGLIFLTIAGILFYRSFNPTSQGYEQS